MPELRFIQTNFSYADFSTSVSPALERALEKGESPNTVVLNIFREGSFTIGVLEDPEKSVDLDYCRREGIVVRRRQNPGGAVWGPAGGGMIVFYLHTVEPWVPLKSIKEAFQKGVPELAASLSRRFSIPAVYRPLNDVEVKGRKLVATSARLENGILTLRYVINLVPTDRGILDRAIRVAPEKIQDKKIKEIGARFTCLEDEAGRKITGADLSGLLVEAVERTFGPALRLKPGELTGSEKTYAAEYQKAFTAEAWFYANSERLRFAAKPAGAVVREGRHKAPAGLIRVTLLIQNNRIQDLIITGDFHPSPYQVIQDMETALKGKACDPEPVGLEIKKLFERPDVEIPGTTADDFISAFNRAVNSRSSGNA